MIIKLRLQVVFTNHKAVFLGQNHLGAKYFQIKKPGPSILPNPGFLLSIYHKTVTAQS
jgi:hypothetical protein